MESSKLSNHSRSISLQLPSSSHPLIASVEQHLDRLRSSKGATSSSHTSTCQNLDGLRNLYGCLEDVLQLPLSQQALSRERNHEVLEGSLGLLDICGTVKDIYSQLKEIVQQLESSLRRKRGVELSNEVDAYMASKKQLNKMICKCSKVLKEAEKRCTLAVANEDRETLPSVNLIKEVQELSLSMLKPTLSIISESKKSSSISKLLKPKKVAQGEPDIAGIQKLEAELLSLKNKKANQEKDLLQKQNLLKGLEAFDQDIQELVEVLEVVFRHLLKTRSHFSTSSTSSLCQTSLKASASSLYRKHCIESYT